MTPFVGEGVNAALRDAVDLAQVIQEAVRKGYSRQALNQKVAAFEECMLKRVTPVQTKTEDMMRLMLFTEGAPRTVMEKWCVRAMKDELNAVMLLLYRIYVYTYYFLFKLLR